MLKVKSTALVCLLGQTAALTKALLSTTTSKVTGATDGLTVEFTRAAGKITKCTEVVISLGLMVAHIKAHTSMIKRRSWYV